MNYETGSAPAAVSGEAGRRLETTVHTVIRVLRGSFSIAAANDRRRSRDGILPNGELIAIAMGSNSEAAPGGRHGFPARLDASAAGDEMEDEHDEGDHQEDVDEAAGDMQGEAAAPE